MNIFSKSAKEDCIKDLHVEKELKDTKIYLQFNISDCPFWDSPAEDKVKCFLFIARLKGYKWACESNEITKNHSTWYNAYFLPLLQFGNGEYRIGEMRPDSDLAFFSAEYSELYKARNCQFRD